MRRYLRITASALCLGVCALMIMLWARSFWWTDYAIEEILDQRTSMIASFKGQILLIDLPTSDLGNSFNGGDIGTSPVEANHSMQYLADGSVWGFKWDLLTDALTLAIPYWFLVLLTATLTALPWLKWRISLRTLLIGTALVAVLLGIFAISN